MEKNRLEAFTDGVLAIIITIMVLELRQPVGDSINDLWALGPTLLTYLISFLFIAIYWVNHHHVFHQVDRVNVPILWCNIAWMFVMSFIPFATAWAGSYPSSFAPLSVYFADMALASITFHLLCFAIVREHNQKLVIGFRSIVSLVTYTAAAIFGGFCPIAALTAVAIVSCLWIIHEKPKKN